MGASIVTDAPCRSTIAGLLVLLVLLSVAPTRGAEISCPDTPLQQGQDDAGPVGLINHQFILRISTAATYLSFQIERVFPRPPVILSPAYRGPPVFFSFNRSR